MFSCDSHVFYMINITHKKLIIKVADFVYYFDLIKNLKFLFGLAGEEKCKRN